MIPTYTYPVACHLCLIMFLRIPMLIHVALIQSLSPVYNSRSSYKSNFHLFLLGALHTWKWNGWVNCTYNFKVKTLSLKDFNRYGPNYFPEQFQVTLPPARCEIPFESQLLQHLALSDFKLWPACRHEIILFLSCNSSVTGEVEHFLIHLLAMLSSFSGKQWSWIFLAWAQLFSIE